MHCRTTRISAFLLTTLFLVATLEVDREADFHLLTRSGAILLDEKQYEPVQGGGVRGKKLGRLDLLDLSGSVKHSFELPEDGKLIAVSADEKLGFYFSPRKLTILDFENGRISGQVDVPFRAAKLAF